MPAEYIHYQPMPSNIPPVAGNMRTLTEMGLQQESSPITETITIDSALSQKEVAKMNAQLPKGTTLEYQEVITNTNGITKTLELPTTYFSRSVQIQTVEANKPISTTSQTEYGVMLSISQSEGITHTETLSPFFLPIEIKVDGEILSSEFDAKSGRVIYKDMSGSILDVSDFFHSDNGRIIPIFTDPDGKPPLNIEFQSPGVPAMGGKESETDPAHNPEPTLSVINQGDTSLLFVVEQSGLIRSINLKNENVPQDAQKWIESAVKPDAEMYIIQDTDGSILIYTDRNKLLIEIDPDGITFFGPQLGTSSATDDVNLRSGPGTENGIIGLLQPGGAFEIIEEAIGWFEIRLSDGSTAWVSAGFVKKESQLELKVDFRQENEEVVEEVGNVDNGEAEDTLDVNRIIDAQAVSEFLLGELPPSTDLRVDGNGKAVDIGESISTKDAINGDISVLQVVYLGSYTNDNGTYLIAGTLGADGKSFIVPVQVTFGTETPLNQVVVSRETGSQKHMQTSLPGISFLQSADLTRTLEEDIGKPLVLQISQRLVTTGASAARKVQMESYNWESRIPNNESLLSNPALVSLNRDQTYDFTMSPWAAVVQR